MSTNDKASELAVRVGGWENLARGLLEYHTTGKSTFLKDALNRTEIERLANLFHPKKRGRPKKWDWVWFFRVEKILAAANNQHEKEETIIDKNLNEICGKVITGKKDRDKKNKTVRNALGTIRKEFKEISATYDPSTDPGVEFLLGYEEPPEGFEYTDDPRLHD